MRLHQRALTTVLVARASVAVAATLVATTGRTGTNHKPPTGSKEAAPESAQGHIRSLQDKNELTPQSSFQGREDEDKALRQLDEALLQQSKKLEGDQLSCRTSAVRGGRLGSECPPGYKCSTKMQSRDVCVKAVNDLTTQRMLQAKKKKKKSIVVLIAKKKTGITRSKTEIKKQPTNTKGAATLAVASVTAPALAPATVSSATPTSFTYTLPPTSTNFPTYFTTFDPTLSPSQETVIPTEQISDVSYGQSCFTGSAALVQALCNKNQGAYFCCTGARACKFRKGATNITVCPGSCNGADACRGLPDDSTAFYDSCNGKNACSFTKPASDAGITFQGGSCVGVAACNGTKATNIGFNACRGRQACNHLKCGQVGTLSCYGSYSCEKSALGFIGDASCKEANSCFDNIGESVGSGSCVGMYACVGSPPKVSIGNNSCLGASSCFLTRGSIGSDSCRSADLDPATANVCLNNHATVGDRSCNNRERVCEAKTMDTIIGNDEFSY